MATNWINYRMKKVYLFLVLCFLALRCSAASFTGSFLSVSTNLQPYANGTNFCVDFNWGSQTVCATGDVYFNYSTNWPSQMLTGRVAQLYFAPSNYFRHVYYVSGATNWHSQPQPLFGVPCGFGATVTFSVYGQGETNVTLTPNIDNTITGTNWLNVGGFCPTNSQGGCVLWLESSQGTYLDENSVSPAPVGTQVKAWTDLSLFVPRMTNQNAANFVYVTTPNITPGNVPSLHWTSGGGANFLSTGFANLAQPNWAFVVWFGRGNNFTWVDGLSEGNRFGCVIGEGLLNKAGAYSGTSVSMTNTPEIAWKLFAWSQNGASSVIRTNGVLGLTANTGTQTPARWSIGSDYNQAAFTGDGYAAEVLIYHTNLTLVQVTNIENYFNLKYGIWKR
jgi:hypothetical protein